MARARVYRVMSLPLLVGLCLPLGAQKPPPRPETLLVSDVRFEAPIEQATEHRLKNGVRVVVVEDSSLPLFELAAALPVGEVLDGPETLGVAATVGALMRRGGAGPWSAQELDQVIDRVGLSASSVGGFRRSGVTLMMSSRSFGSTWWGARDLASHFATFGCGCRSKEQPRATADIVRI